MLLFCVARHRDGFLHRHRPGHNRCTVPDIVSFNRFKQRSKCRFGLSRKQRRHRLRIFEWCSGTFDQTVCRHQDTVDAAP